MICELPHDYRLSYVERPEGVPGGHLVAIIRPNGTPAFVCGAPLALFPRSFIAKRIAGAIRADLKATKKGEPDVE